MGEELEQHCGNAMVRQVHAAMRSEARKSDRRPAQNTHKHTHTQGLISRAARPRRCTIQEQQRRGSFSSRRLIGRQLEHDHRTSQTQWDRPLARPQASKLGWQQSRLSTTEHLPQGREQEHVAANLEMSTREPWTLSNRPMTAQCPRVRYPGRRKHAPTPRIHGAKRRTTIFDELQ